MPRFRTADAKTGRWIGLSFAALYVALASLGGEAKARALGISIGVLFVIGFIAWDFRRKPSFWFTMVPIAVVHTMASLLVPWQNGRIPGFLLVPIFFVDFCVSFSLVYFVLRSDVSR